jgi:fatty acid amide hydrolase
MNLWQAPATKLSAMLERREIGARELLREQLDRIDAVDPRIHAFTEVFREQAQTDADASDARRSRGEARGPLDGLPITVKECFDFAGRATTLGIPSWSGRIAERDAALVTALREAGAVILGRTNLSQTMLYVEARNPLFGQTANPWSPDHSPGGSSGGEGAAIASGMSPLGVGSDIGGSIRTPAHFCGVAGLKPSLDRLPARGLRGLLAGQEAVRAVAGPLARTVGDLALFFRTLDPRRLSALDPRVPPVPWEEPDRVRLEGLRVGVYRDDGILAPSKAIARAVDRAAAVLAARGCTTKPFVPPDVRGVLSAYLGALSADGGAGVLAALAGGEVDPVLEPLTRIASLPASLRRLLAMGARAFGQGNLALMLDAMGDRSGSELWALTARLRAHQDALLDAMDRAGVDFLLCPPLATPAMPHGGSKNFSLASSYAILFNAIQLPAGIVPVTRVRPDEASRPIRGLDLLQRQAAKIDARSAGLPVGVQVVGRSWRDSAVLALMAAIEAEVSRDEGYPATPVPSREPLA